MEPRIQYAQTKDGVSIAYWRMGNGPPMIHLPPNIWGHLQLERAHPEWRTWHDALAQRLSLIRFDSPGMGLSDRDTADFTLTRMAEYVDAVADHLGLDRFAIFSPIDTGPLGITYAATRTDRVSHLVLYCTFAATSTSGKGTGSFKGARQLLEENWEIFVRTSTSVAFGWTSEQAAWWADFMKESVTHENYKQFFSDRQGWDAASLLQDVKVPTLVVQRRQIEVPSVAVARGIAAKIPDAHLAILEGDQPAPYTGDMDTLVATVCDFLTHDEAQAAPDAPIQPGDSAFRTVLFTDLVGHTEMMSRLGDDRGREVLRQHERISREVLAANGGTEVKTMGDGFMASFGSVTKAVECAIALQRAFDQYGGESLAVRVGLNAGEPIEEDGDLFGATVILASRIAAKAEGGEILVADTVRGLCSGKGFLFADRGEFVAKGFEDSVRLYEVSWRG